MKTYVIAKSGQIEVREKPIPVPGEHEVLIRVKTIGICGSDAHLYSGTYQGPQNFPLMFGHEWSGFVESAGSSVKGFSPGDLVTGDCSRFCGTCKYCMIDKNVCRNIEKFGITVDGASAEYIVRDARYLYKAPQSINPSLLALAEPLAVSAHHLEKVLRVRDLPKDSDILITGAGGIGLGAYLLLRYRYGFSAVSVADISAKRRFTAADLGASLYELDGVGKTAGTESYASLYGEGGFDCIIDTTGNAAVFSRTIDLLRPLGVSGSIGMSTGSIIDQKKIVLKALTLVGTIGGTGNFPEVIDFIARNEKLVSSLVSHEYPMERVDEALVISTKSNEAVKVLVHL
jgi:L-iditol 2-dehydrogenase